MSPRIAIVALSVFFVLASAFVACGGPETFHEKGNLASGTGGTSGTTGVGGDQTTGVGGDQTTGVGGDQAGAGGDQTGVAGATGTGGDQTMGVAGTTGAGGDQTTGVAGATGTGGVTAGTGGTTGTGGSTTGTGGTGGTTGTGGAGGTTGTGGTGGTTGMGGTGGSTGTAGMMGTAGTSGPVTRIDAGNTTAAVGQWAVDTDFTGGGLNAATTNAIDLTGVTNPAPQAVYQTGRVGRGSNLSYTVPGYTAGSMHTVRLHFCETYWTVVGKRICNISLNGTQVLPNYDIFAKSGAQYKAVIEQFTVAANASGYVVQFTNVTDQCLLMGLEIQ